MFLAIAINHFIVIYFGNAATNQFVTFCSLYFGNAIVTNQFAIFFLLFQQHNFFLEIYVHNIFTTFLQKILSGKLLLIIIIMAKT